MLNVCISILEILGFETNFHKFSRPKTVDSLFSVHFNEEKLIFIMKNGKKFVAEAYRNRKERDTL